MSNKLKVSKCEMCKKRKSEGLPLCSTHRAPKKERKIKAWAVVDTADSWDIPVFDAGYLKAVPDVEVWAVFSEEDIAKKVLKLAKKWRGGHVDKNTKVVPITITYHL